MRLNLPRAPPCREPGYKPSLVGEHTAARRQRVAMPLHPTLPQDLRPRISVQNLDRSACCSFLYKIPPDLGLRAWVPLAGGDQVRALMGRVRTYAICYAQLYYGTPLWRE
jgi:hypothetical protein